MRPARIIPYLILIIGGLIFLQQGFGELFTSPNHFMLDTGVDGLKNYFNPMYFLKYDQGTHFSGMNYPFGEHLVFTDGQPLITWSIKAISNILPVGDGLPGIFNLAMFLGLIITMVLMFEINRFFGLPIWYSILIAWIIALLSPQLHRLAGHYALAYTFVIPFIWYLLLRIHNSSGKNWFPSLVLVVSMCLFSLIHVYYVMIGSIFILSYFLVASIGMRKARKGAILHFIMGLLIAILPLVFFKFFLSITDNIIDRPSNPYGFFDHLAYYEGIFFPASGPVRDFLSFFADIKNVVNEGYAYVGIPASLVVIFSVVRGIRFGLKSKWKRILRPALPDQMGNSLLAGILVLLFSMGIPFVWGLEPLLDLLSPLKQFRSLGRFAWVFFYIFTVYAGFYYFLIWRRLRIKKLKSLGISFLAVVLIFWWAESWIHVSQRKQRIEKWEHVNIIRQAPIDYNQWVTEAGYSVSDFQAILPLPAFFIGSEKIYTERIDYFSSRHGMLAAYQTGLPLTSGLLSRTSLSQTLQLAQLLSSKWIKKTILDDFPNDKPLLVLGVKDAPLTDSENELLGKGELLGEIENLQLLKLPLSSFETAWGDFGNRFDNLKDTLVESNSLLLSDSSWVYYDPIGPEKEGFPAKGPLVKKGPQILFDSPIPDSGNYKLSLWVRANLLHDGFPVVFLKEWNNEGQHVQWKEANPKFKTEVFKDFVRVDIPFYCSGNSNKFTVSVEGKYIETSSLLIQKEGVDIYKVFTDSSFMFNNYYLEKD